MPKQVSYVILVPSAFIYVQDTSGLNWVSFAALSIGLFSVMCLHAVPMQIIQSVPVANVQRKLKKLLIAKYEVVTGELY